MKLEHVIGIEAARILTKSGYIVKHQSEAGNTLAWNRMSPIPSGINFEDEAVERICNQITKQHLLFDTYTVPKLHATSAFDGTIDYDTIYRARLLLLL